MNQSGYYCVYDYIYISGLEIRRVRRVRGGPNGPKKSSDPLKNKHVGPYGPAPPPPKISQISINK